MRLNLTTAFRRFGAQLTNVNWACSAIASDGAVVISCWQHYLKPRNGVLEYVDRLSRWRGHNIPGNNLLRSHLEEARRNCLPVRLVLATAEDTEAVDRGEDASKIKKTFGVRTDLVGQVVEFDGDRFVIAFSKDKGSRQQAT